jgi:uncharacterized protein YcbX
MRVQSVHVYPVKATAPVSVPTTAVTRAGLHQDRRWAVVTVDGHLLTGGDEPGLLLVTASPDQHGNLTLSHPGHPALEVPQPREGPRVATDVSRLAYAVDAGHAAAQWFSAVLGRPVRLVWQDDPGARTIATLHGGTGDEPLNLADTGPVLLTVTSSLDQLNAWVAGGPDPAPVSMQRFRPNVVVETAGQPFEEDHWRRVRIGEVVYRFAEHCDRCHVTMIDPHTQARRKEPIRTLALRHRWDGKTWFGIRLVPLGPGTVGVGDPVVVEQTA